MHKNSFFWEKASARKRTKTRFNLLLLEYGEYFVDDVGVFQYPNPDDGSGRDFFQCDALKVQGRMKMCTRSFIFEPTDGRKPLLKFPFKYMSPGVVEYPLSASQKSQCTIETSGFFSFTCSTVYEMKDDAKIAPYKQVDCPDPKEPAEYFFAASHSNIGQLLTKMSQLREIYTADEKGELSVVARLLAELTNTAPTAIFDASKLIDFHEKLRMDLAIGVKKIKPLVLYPGYIMLTDLRIYFQPGELNNVGEATQHYDLGNIFRLYKRRYLLMDTALELIMSDGESVLFCFDSTSGRDYIHDSLNSEPHLHNSRVTISDMTMKWQRREVSNFDYLMFVNNEAGRSLSDLAQYPIFPHVITDYTSKSLDLTKSETFRDLSKPVGALNPQRLEFFKERMMSMPPEDAELGIPPQFLYGTHYSTPGYVLYYLVRVAPEHMLCLQNGKFDSTDRMFISLADTWDSCLNNPADLKELIPEFFCGKSGEFLVNISDLDLGRRQTGERLHDVELPPWAKSPKDFIKKHTKALECDYVSEHIHEWIDLIFGVCQRGEMALEHDNLFYHLTYEGAVDMETISDQRQRRALEVQIQEFGQTPRQVFFSRHPLRGQAVDIGGYSETISDKKGSTLAISPLPKLKVEEKLLYSPHITSTRVHSENEPIVDHLGHKELPTKVKELLPTDISEQEKSSVLDHEAMDPVVNDPVDGIIELGLDFQEEVERVLQAEQDGIGFVAANNSCEGSARSQSVGNSVCRTSDERSSDLKVVESSKPSAYFGSWVGAKIGSIWGSAVGRPAVVNNSENMQQKSFSGDRAQSTDGKKTPDHYSSDNPIGKVGVEQRSSSLEVKEPHHFNTLPRTKVEGRRADAIIMHSSDPFQAHSEAITGLSLSSDKRSITSSSKDATMKVLRISYLEHAGSLSREWIQLSVRRSFSASDPPLSGCLVLSSLAGGEAATATFVLFSSWDSAIYSYSIPNACMVGKKVAHDDGISALGCDRKMNKVASGSWDASVKVWPVVLSTGLLSTVPEAEFFDHDTPVQCVAIDESAIYVAAGAEDGRLCVWSIGGGGSLVLQRQISAAGKAASDLIWVPYEEGSLLIACSVDGTIICIDFSNKNFGLVASGQLETGLQCIQYDPLGIAGSLSGLTLFTGFSDGSLRLVSMLDGGFIDVTRHMMIHPGGITSLCLSEKGDLLVSGGDDGCVRVWEIK